MSSDAARDAVDSRHLAVVRVVADAGSFTKAARALHISQPAVTATIQRLEGALGVALFERHARGVVPTDAGRKLAGHARRMDALLDEALADVTERQEHLAPLVIGASTTIASGLMPRLISQFRASEGAVSVRLVVGNTTRILEDVRARRIPLGLAEGPSRAQGLHLSRFLDDTLLPVVAASGPERPRIESSLDLPVLWREVGSGTRTVVERALRKVGRRPEPRDLELGSTAAIRKAALLKLGVAFLSRWSIDEDLAAGRLRVVPVEGLAIRRRFSWVMPSAQLSGTAARFHDYALRAVDALATS
jgi:DNA-binding transcriptional LysR family regulator